MDTFFATKKGGRSSRGHTCCQLFVTDKGFLYVVPMRRKSEVLQAIKQFAKEIGCLHRSLQICLVNKCPMTYGNSVMTLEQPSGHYTATETYPKFVFFTLKKIKGFHTLIKKPSTSEKI